MPIFTQQHACHSETFSLNLSHSLTTDVVLHELRILSPEVVQYKHRLHEACVARLLVREWIYPILIYFIQSFFKKFGWVGGGSASLFLKFAFMWNTIGISINWILLSNEKKFTCSWTILYWIYKWYVCMSK